MYHNWLERDSLLPYEGRTDPSSFSVLSLLFSKLLIIGCLMICSLLVKILARERNLLGSVSIRVGLEWVSSGLRYLVSKPPHFFATHDLSGLFTWELKLSVPPSTPENTNNLNLNFFHFAVSDLSPECCMTVQGWSPAAPPPRSPPP